jgi:(R,R)-butanediol dehydrogenase/meso-butanediol dehydrogenase/diacetyl reductase
MRAAVFRGVGRKLSIEDVPMPVPGDGELILKVAYCGICGSDLHVTQPGAMLLPEGSILGHEFAGEVVEARGSKWKPGQRVAAIPLWECDLCAPHGCQKGLGALCQQNRFIGVADGVPGAYAQYVRLRDSHVLPLPDAVSLRDAALLEPLAVGQHGIAKAGDLTGANVLVLGAGPIGLATAICARLAGARRVMISELTESRRALAGGIGVDGVIDPAAGPVGKAFTAIAGAKPDVIFECVGVPGLIQQAIGLSQPFGRIVVVGVCMVQDNFLPVAAVSKELNFQFVMGYTRADFDYVLDHVDAGRIDVEKLITTIVGFDELPDVFEELRTGSGHTKVLIKPN